MTTKRRVGAESSKTRAHLLDHAERLMIDDGYAAVTYRRVATAAAVAPALVQYYFPSQDELFIALVRRRTDESLTKLTRSFASRSPLRVLFDYSSDPRGAALTAELHALANHRKAIQAELRDGGERVRRLALEAIATADRHYELPELPVSPEVLVFLMTAMPRMLVMEGAVGMMTSLAETKEFLRQFLDRAEPG